MCPSSWLWEHFHKGEKANSTQLRITLTNISICQIQVFFRQKNPTTIDPEDLFDWTVKNGWNLFWDKHYQEEMLFYELLSQVEDEPPSQASALTVGSSGRSSTVPIDVDATT